MRSPNGIRPRPMRARRIPNRWPPASVLTQSPDLLKILESLQVVFLFESAFDSEFRQDRHHLSDRRSEEHTSELQSQSNLVCRLLLEKKKNNDTTKRTTDRTRRQQ